MSNVHLFEDIEIRSFWNENEQKRYFVVKDIIAILTDYKDSKQYIKRMRERNVELDKKWDQIVISLPIMTQGGPQKMRCTNIKGLICIIQYIPSRKAALFNLWLDQFNTERFIEVENSELNSMSTLFHS